MKRPNLYAPAPSRAEVLADLALETLARLVGAAAFLVLMGSIGALVLLTVGLL